MPRMRLVRRRLSRTWRLTNWARLPTRSKQSVKLRAMVMRKKRGALNARGSVRNFQAKSARSCLTTKNCATNSVGSYSIVDRIVCQAERIKENA